MIALNNCLFSNELATVDSAIEEQQLDKWTYCQWQGKLVTS